MMMVQNNNKRRRLVAVYHFVLSYGAVLHLVVVLLVLFNRSFVVKDFDVCLLDSAVVSILRDGSSVPRFV